MSEGLRTALVNMDGVLANFDAHLQAVIEQEYPVIAIPKTRSHFYFHHEFPPEEAAIVKAIKQRPQPASYMENQNKI